MSEEKRAALAAHLNVSVNDIQPLNGKDDTLECTSEPGEYMVLTESERDKAADDALESYVDDGLFAGALVGEPYDTLRQYFDRDAWKRDALINDGYGHTLSPYDGQEYEQKIDGTWYYVYRVN